jgi:hypothetical protein
MIRCCMLIALLAPACVQVQDLGTDRVPETVTTSSAAPETTVPPAIPPAPTAKCPVAMPLEATACECGARRTWTCLRVRDDFSRYPIPVQSMTITTASCTEGAPCSEGTKCRVGKERACECMSSGRLRCERPVF